MSSIVALWHSLTFFRRIFKRAAVALGDFLTDQKSRLFLEAESPAFGQLHLLIEGLEYADQFQTLQRLMISPTPRKCCS
jgi:hypothetical protein